MQEGGWGVCDKHAGVVGKGVESEWEVPGECAESVPEAVSEVVGNVGFGANTL